MSIWNRLFPKQPELIKLNYIDAGDGSNWVLVSKVEVASQEEENMFGKSFYLAVKENNLIPPFPPSAVYLVYGKIRRD